MKAVDVEELKTRLSEYLRLEDILDALADAGDISRASLPKRGWGWRSRGLGLMPGTAQALVDELRGDR